MSIRGEKSSGSLDWTIVKEALRRAMQAGRAPGGRTGPYSQNTDIDISLLLNDVFGGRIVKTHTRRGWHFYNRINGERIDLAAQEAISSFTDSDLDAQASAREKSPVCPELNDYTSLFQRFVTALDESFGLGKYQPA